MPFSRQAFSGFPFDREPDRDRDGHFRSQLDDLAKRHPELAEHLGSFSRRRQSSGEDAEDFHRRFERPFAGQFERFGFPFDRDNFDPEQYAQQFYQQHPEFQRTQQQSEFQHPQSQGYQQQPDNQHNSSYQPQYQPQPEFQQPQQSQPQYSPPEYSENLCGTSEKDRNNIQQSNTIDLGQKQEPVSERNQRSMSAPPTEKGQRFTSSINIPVNQPCEEENMAQTQADGKTTERIIPIHIEGRDEPVLPKTAPATFSQPYQSYSAGAQPERIFGQRPEQFTQFVNREPRQFDKWHRPGFDQMHHGFAPDDLLRQQRYPQQNVPPHYQQQQQPQQQHHVPQPQPKHEMPIPVQREAPQTKQAPQQQTVPPQEPPQPKQANQTHKPKTPVELIQDIQKDVSNLMIQVEQFAGQPKDKQYLYLDEMLTRNLLKLDNIDTQGQESIRSARKEAIKCIEKAISVLESKAASNVEPKTGEKMEVEEKPQEPSENCEKENKETEVQNMETEQPVPEGKVVENEPGPMEFSPENTQQSNPDENKEDKEHPSTESTQVADPAVENRAVLVVTSENKETPKVEDNVEPMETKDDDASSTAPVVVPNPDDSCEGQEKNLPVAEAVKKFEGMEDEKKGEIKSEQNKEDTRLEGEKVVEEKVVEKSDQKVEDKKEEKKEKKKGKKKVEKKEK